MTFFYALPSTEIYQSRSDIHQRLYMRSTSLRILYGIMSA